MGAMVDKTKESLRALGGELKEAAPLVPVVARKPAVALFWLKVSRQAQIALLAGAILVPTLLTWSVDSVLGKIYSEKQKGSLTGFFEKASGNPKLQRAKSTGHTLLWITAAGVVVVLLLRRLPSAISEAEDESKSIEREADAMVKHDPEISVRRYRAAIDMTLDNGRTAMLQGKMTGSSSGATMVTAPSAAAEGTAVIAPSGASADATMVGAPQRSGASARYRIVDTLGKGAMGVVYLAHDDVLERDVAVKELHANLAHDRDLVQRFRQEAKVLAKMAHPGVVLVHDFVEDGDAVWIVMEFVRGRELADHMKERGPMPVGEIKELGVKLAKALAYAHGSGIVHRDFKPANVLLTASGEPKIMDFGLAKLVESAHHTMAGTILGSPAYMSPEQAEGRNADARSDIYALGVVLYRMATGKVPFEGDLTSVIAQHISKPPVPPLELNPGTPAPLNALILDMLAKSPDDRPASMEDVAERLAAIV